MRLEPLLPAPALQDLVATILTFGAMIVWLGLVDALTKRALLPQHLSRKVIHIGTGPLFLICWNLYSQGTLAPWLAALVPGAITLRFAAIGWGWIEDSGAVDAMSRTGDARELLHGPVYYGLVFVAATILFWRNSPVGIVALMILSGGDGPAEIIGRRLGRQKLPWSPSKSWAGSSAMLLGGFGLSAAMVFAFDAWGYFRPDLDPEQTLVAVFLIALAATVVESLPVDRLDNLTIFAASLAAAWLLAEGVEFWQAPFWGPAPLLLPAK